MLIVGGLGSVAGALLGTVLPAAQRISALAPLLPVWTLLEFG